MTFFYCIYNLYYSCPVTHFLFSVYCNRFCHFTAAHCHAGVTMCHHHDSSSINVTCDVMISDVYTNYFTEYLRGR